MQRSRILLLATLPLALFACDTATPVEDAGDPGIDAGPPPDPLCDDLMQNGTESDVDCGGLDCDPCPAGRDCGTGEDCASRVCGTAGTCETSSCDDTVINGDETGVDCGGLDCDPCDNGQGCEEASDCMSNMCAGDICRGPLCFNGRLDGFESDIDCGGGDCDPCEGGLMCHMDNAEVDCVSTICVDGICTEPTCTDSTLNRDESDVDCGGIHCAPCEVGEMCNRGSDCESLSCGTGLCRRPNCGDGIENGGEIGIDCGPVCETPVCPTCTDGVQNGFETDLDCGGSDCDPCPDGSVCRDGDDCEFGTCTHDWCGIGLAFAGFATFAQDCRTDTDVEQDAAMDAACAAAYVGTRAATMGEMTSEGLILGQPATNTTGRWLMGTCPGCIGLDDDRCVEGHFRLCLPANQSFFDGLPAFSGGCGWNTRGLVCIFD